MGAVHMRMVVAAHGNEVKGVTAQSTYVINDSELLLS